MRTRTTLILLILATLLTAFVLLIDSRRPGTDTSRAEEGRLLPGITLDEITRLEIDRPRETLVVTREGEGFRILSPLEDEADRVRTEDLLRSLLDLSSRTDRAPEAVTGGDEATGLGTKALRAHLVTDASETILEVGSRSIAGGLRFARVPGRESLALVDERAAELLLTPLGGLRERKIFPLAPLETESLTIHSAKEDIHLARRGRERWWIESPLDDEADPAAVNQLLSQLAALRADGFADATETALGFDPPQLTLVAKPRDEDHDEVCLELGDAIPAGNGSFYLRRQGREAVFEIYLADLLRDLRQPAEALRSRKILDFSPWEVVEVELSRGGESVRVTRVDGENEAGKTWAAMEPANFPLDSVALAELLSSLETVDAQRIAPEGETMLGKPLARLRLYFRDAETSPPILIELGVPTGEGGVYVRRDGRKTLLVMDRAVADRIDPAQIRRSPPDKETDGAAPEPTRTPPSAQPPSAPRPALPPSESSRSPSTGRD